MAWPFRVFTSLTSLLARQPQSLSHRVRFLQHFNVREPDDFDPLRLQHGRTFAVFGALRRLHMSSAIHLHCQTQLVAIEVHHVGLNWVLTAKLRPKLPATNQVPHHPFGVCLSSPQRACQRKQLGRSLLERRVDPTHVDPIGVSKPTSLQPGEISTHYRAPAPDAGHTLDERQRDLPAEMPRTTCRPRRNPQAGSLIFPLSPWERVRVRVFRSKPYGPLRPSSRLRPRGRRLPSLPAETPTSRPSPPKVRLLILPLPVGVCRPETS